jgi:ribosome-binding factor A
MKPYRLPRVAEAIREVASKTILFELNDPRIKDVTVTRAEVSADLQHAKVYVSIMGSQKEQQICLSALKNARGYLQRKVGDRLQVRYTPQVQFVLDKGVKHSIEISRLIKEALEKGLVQPGEGEAPAEPLSQTDGSAGASPSRPASSPEDTADGTAAEDA